MDADIAGWTPALERTFKELLYRFLENVQATKAALYLLADDGSYILATQYGFGRRDLLAAHHGARDPMVLLVRQLRSAPRAYNSPDEIPELASYLEGAGTARLLLVPLHAASRILGFVDVRDKGRRRKFSPVDVESARAIAADILANLRKTHLYSELDEEPATEPAVRSLQDAVPATAPPPESPPDTEALASLLAHALTVGSCRHVHGVAVTHVAGEHCKTLLVAANEPTAEDVAALREHQGEELQRQGWPAPPAEWWDVLFRRADGASQVGGRVIATSGALLRSGVPLVLSVVATNASEAKRYLGSLLETARQQVHVSELRFSRRRLLRKLLAPSPNESDPLRRHGEQVSRLAWALGQTLSLRTEELEDTTLAGLVHDIGLPEILGVAGYQNPNPAPEERQMFRRHVQAGERILRDLGLGQLASIVRHHHERWDGSGYPDRLAGETIPLASRIVHVAEVYDVLTSPTSYRKTVSPQRALAIVKAAAGSQFDPRLVMALEKALR